MSKEMVIHPEHYNQEGRKECWEEMLDLFGPEAVCIFDCLNAYKYNYRKGNKENNSLEQDESKIRNYLIHSADIIASTDERNMAKARKCYKIVRDVINNGANR